MRAGETWTGSSRQSHGSLPAVVALWCMNIMSKETKVLRNMVLDVFKHVVDDWRMKANVASISHGAWRQFFEPVYPLMFEDVYDSEVIEEFNWDVGMRRIPAWRVAPRGRRTMRGGHVLPPSLGSRESTGSSTSC